MLFKRYLTQLFISILSLLAVAGAFNLLVDPYGLFGLARIQGVNALKPEIIKHARMYKAHAIRRIEPDAIILGSSRADTGLDPAYPGWGNDIRKPYNLALHSANIEEVLSYLQHAQFVHPLKEAVIGLDFFMFNVNKDVEIDFDLARLEPSAVAPFGWFQDLFRALFTFDALHASARTLASQNDPSVINYGDNGFRDDSMKWAAIATKGGHRQAAINNERYTLVSGDGFPFFSIADAQGQSPTLEAFRKIIRFSSEHGIRLHLFISPTHARRLLLLREIGLWDQFEQWKRRLVEILAEENAPFRLWDFSALNPITTEPFPPLGDTRTRMKWYWESSHYTKAVGQLVLDRILGQQTSETGFPENFGLALTPENVEAQLALIAGQVENYRQTHPDNVREIRNMIRKTRKKREALFRAHPGLAPKHRFEIPSDRKQPSS